MSETSSDPSDQGTTAAAGTSPQDPPPGTPDAADTEHPVGEEQAQRNIDQEPPG